MMSTEATRSLSARGSRNLPREVTRLKRRAMYPSKTSVTAAAMNTSVAARHMIFPG
jgi:hypothetical protein